MLTWASVADPAHLPFSSPAGAAATPLLADDLPHSHRSIVCIFLSVAAGGTARSGPSSPRAVQQQTPRIARSIDRPPLKFELGPGYKIRGRHRVLAERFGATSVERRRENRGVTASVSCGEVKGGPLAAAVINSVHPSSTRPRGEPGTSSGLVEVFPGLTRGSRRTARSE